MGFTFDRWIFFVCFLGVVFFFFLLSPADRVRNKKEIRYVLKRIDKVIITYRYDYLRIPRQ